MGETATDRAELLEAVMVYYSSFEVGFILLLICFLTSCCTSYEYLSTTKGLIFPLLPQNVLPKDKLRHVSGLGLPGWFH